MDGISLIGLSLLELEELDVLVELATEPPLVLPLLLPPPLPFLNWWDGGGGAEMKVIILSVVGTQSFSTFLMQDLCQDVNKSFLHLDLMEHFLEGRNIGSTLIPNEI